MRQSSRREFLDRSWATASTLTLGGLTAASAARAAGANDRLAVGIVGPGGRGTSILKTFFDVRKAARADLVAVCDLWSRNRERSAELVKQQTGSEPQQFRRLDDLLAMNGLDAVIMASARRTAPRSTATSMRSPASWPIGRCTAAGG